MPNDPNKINQYLNKIGDVLTIPKEIAKIVDDKYKEVSDLLKSQKEFKDKEISIEVYPQGSYELKTTIKPMTREEFDLDFVFKVNNSDFSPKTIYMILERALREKYGADVVGEKKRCVRLYVSSKFYLDIIPAIPFDDKAINSAKIKIPQKNKELNSWDIIPSDPKGYSEWFKDQSLKSKGIYLEGDMKRSSLPSPTDHSELPVLNKVVRIFKRHRDIYFQNQEEKPTSIILTTLCGQLISDEIEGTFQDWKKIVNQISSRIKNSSEPFSVKNPSCREEDFGDKWKNQPSLYEDFKNYINVLLQHLAKLENYSNEKELQFLLKQYFGEDKRITEAIESFSIPASVSMVNKLNYDPPRSKPYGSNHE